MATVQSPRRRQNDSGTIPFARVAADRVGPRPTDRLFLRRFEPTDQGTSPRPALAWTLGNTALGRIALAVRGDEICSLSFADSLSSAAEHLQRTWPLSHLRNDARGLVPLLDELSSRIAGRAPKRRLRLLLRGTDFQFQVWRWLLSVPPGCAISYSELARRAGCPTAVRAVASCMASNPIAFLIPCHRVIRNSGHIGEYRWGARIKAQLLEREGYRPETYL